MSEAKHDPSMLVDRRTILRRAVWLVGGAGAAGVLAGCGDQTPDDPVMRMSGSGRYFSAIRMTRLKAIAETMIPETDTPGAIAAKVPEFIDNMMADWAAEETRQQFDRTIDRIDALAVRQGHDHFTRLTDDQRLAVLSAFDEDQLSKGNQPYRRFKDLVLLGYYHSEIGATQELQYELIPGALKACLPLEEVGRAWAD